MCTQLLEKVVFYNIYLDILFFYTNFKIVIFQELEVCNSYIVNQKMFTDPVIAKHLKEEEGIQDGHVLGKMPKNSTK